MVSSGSTRLFLQRPKQIQRSSQPAERRAGDQGENSGTGPSGRKFPAFINQFLLVWLWNQIKIDKQAIAYKNVCNFIKKRIEVEISDRVMSQFNLWSGALLIFLNPKHDESKLDTE